MTLKRKRYNWKVHSIVCQSRSNVSASKPVCPNKPVRKPVWKPVCPSNVTPSKLVRPSNASLSKAACPSKVCSRKPVCPSNICSSTRVCLKLVSAIFYQTFIFSPNDSPSKTMKNVFYFT